MLRSRLVPLAALTGLVVAAACAGGPGGARPTTTGPSSAPAATAVVPAPAAPQATTPTSTPAATAAPAPATTAPPPRRPPLVVVILENREADAVLGSPAAPHLAALAAGGVVLTASYAITHPSLPNYLALVSGSTQGITSDCGTCSVDGPDLGSQLTAAGIAWRAYLEGFPGDCSNVASAGAYARKHDPFLYFAPLRADPAACANVQGLDRLRADAAAGTLPEVAFVVPDLDHDMHGTGGETTKELTATGDAVVSQIVATLEASPSWTAGSRLVVTFDEGSSAASCCGGTAKGGRIATVVAGPGLAPGEDPTPTTHYDVLRSLETRLGVAYLGHAADATAHDVPAIVSGAAG